MRVCVLKESLTIGGTERSAANTSKLLSRDYDTVTALFDARDIQYDYGGRLMDFGVPAHNGKFRKLFNTYLRDRKLRNLIQKERFDILYQFTAISNPLTFFPYSNTKKIISARDYGAMERRYKKYHAALRHASAMICNSAYIRDFYLSKYPKDVDKVFVVYNVIDAELIARQAQEPCEPAFEEFLSTHSFNIVSVGRFCKEKGFEYLLKTFAHIRKEKSGTGLVLVGDGSYRVKYEEIIKEHGLEKDVYFTGFQNNPYKYMTRCQMYVLSSVSEGFPNVLPEAMVLGLPVLSVNCYSGPAEILMDEPDYRRVTDAYETCAYGVLTPHYREYGDEYAIRVMSEALARLMTDRTLYNQYSTLSKKRAKVFSEEAALQKMNFVFARIMEQKTK